MNSFLPKLTKKVDQFVPRLIASRILSISVRTLDRAAACGRIKSYRRGGRVYFSLSELQDLARYYLDSSLSTLSVPLSSSGEETVSLSGKIGDSVILKTPGVGDSVTSHNRRGESSDLLSQIQQDFRALLEKQEDFQRETIQKFQKDLSEAQKRLEAANYRVGQLESALQNSIPLLESIRKSEQLATLEESVACLKSTIHEEKFAKVLYWLLALIMTGITVFTLLFW